jgi:hypothetical protein
MRTRAHKTVRTLVPALSEDLEMSAQWMRGGALTQMLQLPGVAFESVNLLEH